MNSTKFEEKVIGFDVKRPPSSLRPWSIESRRRFLFRTDVELPLSLDHYIWESCDLNPCKNWIGPNPPFWEDLSQLEKKVQSKLSTCRFPYWIICATVIVVEGKEDEWWELKKTTEFPSFQRWEKLGYDVMDNWVSISGLSGCGHEPRDEMDPAANELSPYLNQYHLFIDVSSAWRYKQWADKDIPEHSPFNVFGIYRVT
jgi:hypothetical protein